MPTQARNLTSTFRHSVKDAKTTEHDGRTYVSTSCGVFGVPKGPRSQNEYRLSLYVAHLLFQ